MKEKREEIKAYLMQAREAAAELARNKSRVQQLELRCRKMTATLSGNFGGDAYERGDAALVLLCDAREEALAAMEREQERLREIGAFIDRVEGADVLRIILRLRYLEYLNWAAVQRAMERVGLWYSERQILRLHEKALEAAAALWPEHKAAA